MEQIKVSELFSRLKPFILDLISIVGGGGGPFAPSPHDLSSGHHTGSLSDAQAPQFLKTDGSRTLVGNLTVTDGITIDGVDLSVLQAAYNTHAGLDAATAHGSVGVHTHQTNAQGGKIDHGAALDGLSDDDHTQYASADGSGTRRAYEAQRLNKTITAGAGLTGGGLLTADRTIDVGTGTGILVSADAVAIDTGANLTWTGDHIFQGLTKTRHLQPEATDTYDLGSSTVLWRKGWLSELDTIIFAQNTVTLVGGWLVIGKNEGALAADVIDTDTQIDFGQSMTTGDFVLFRAALKVEYMSVGSLVSGTVYNVTRNLDGSGANSWPAGTPYAVLGQSGAGRIELNAYDTPRMQMIRQGASYNAQTELIRMGDLNGNWGYTGEKWGLAIGEYASGKPNITIDQDGVLRFRLHTTEVMKFEAGNADLTGKLRMPGTSSAIAIGSTPPTAANAGTGIWIDRTGLYALSSGTYQVKIDAGDGKLYAGVGNVILESNGIQIIQGTTNGSKIKWTHSGTNIATLHAEGTSNVDVYLSSFGFGSGRGTVNLGAYNIATGGVTTLKIDPNNGILIEALTGGVADISLSGYIKQSYAIGCAAYHNTAQALAVSGTIYAIALNSEHWDHVPSGVSEMHSNSTNNSRITCRVAGWYLITFGLNFESNNSGYRMAGIRLNGSTLIETQRVPAVQGSSTLVNVSTLYYLSVGDYVDGVGQQTSGGSLNALSEGNHSPELRAVRIA